MTGELVEIPQYKNQVLSLKYTNEPEYHCPRCEEPLILGDRKTDIEHHDMYCWKCLRPFFMFVYTGDMGDCDEIMKDRYDFLKNVDLVCKQIVVYEW